MKSMCARGVNLGGVITAAMRASTMLPFEKLKGIHRDIRAICCTSLQGVVRLVFTLISYCST